MTLLEGYLRELYETRSSGANLPELSYYPALANLLNEVGRTLKPRVSCVMSLKNQGAGMPDGGLFSADQIPRLPAGVQPLSLIPALGVIEAKPTSDDAWLTAGTPQVSAYWEKYRKVLVTNYRDFLLIGQDQDGNPVRLESYRLARDSASFWKGVAHPRKMAAAHEERFLEYLRRVMLHLAPLAAPEDLARLLASYARDARLRIEGADLPALAAVRSALEEALGIRFEGVRGDHFFRSTLVQTLFYGIFSAWVLWCEKNPEGDKPFNWHETSWWLHVPMIRALFEQVATPARLGPLGLVEVLDWASGALDRVDRASFFSRFEQAHAIQYFYEPFLESFDPELRKELGVWYTPPEIVRYMVARVDAVLREELGIEDGLADPRVYVLDPCCGTGAYLVEVLNRIAEATREKGWDALSAEGVKRAAMERVFGFEIMPAPFVIAHWQLGLLLQRMGAPLAGEKERAGVYLTNALTGWEPPDPDKEKWVQLSLAGMPELKEERDAARRVKRDAPILVVLGNPPYNGFAGMAVEEERALSDGYRATRRVAAPQGQGLNDLYVRFFRMAERRITEGGEGRGIVCFISNYSWLDGLSFTGMRERYLEAFDRIWIDCLNGDKYKTGKVAPNGQPDPSVFSTEFNPEGIRVGTAIALSVRKGSRGEVGTVGFRHLWGREKRNQLLDEASGLSTAEYDEVQPPLGLGLPFTPAQVADEYLGWPLVIDLLPTFHPGVKTSRDLDLVDIDLATLRERMGHYFDPTLGDEAMGRVAPSLTASSAGYDSRTTRDTLLTLGIDSGYFVSYCYRPFDVRHLYWHPNTKLIDRKREELFHLCQSGSAFLTARQRGERTQEGSPFYVTRHLPDWHLTRPGSMCFPATIDGIPAQEGLFTESVPEAPGKRANVSLAAEEYLDLLHAHPPEGGSNLLWLHSLAIGHSPLYLAENAGALRQDWPRVPLPAAGERLLSSAELGRRLADLLDPDAPVKGVTTGSLRPEIKLIASVSRVGGGSLKPAAGELAVNAGWGHAGKGGITMPGQGRLVSRAYSPEELAAIEEGATALGFSLEEALRHLGPDTRDVYLNGVAFWRNVPARVWGYTIGGYQVIKKWLSYRERDLLGRDLSAGEVHEVSSIARRIAAILLMEPALDDSYRAAKESVYPWPSTTTPGWGPSPLVEMGEAQNLQGTLALE